MNFRILVGDALEQLATLPADSVDCCATSPPYFRKRNYGHKDQIGLELTPEEYVNRLGDAFEGVFRVLKPGGTCWVNIGDSYANDNKWGGSTGGFHQDGLHGKTDVGRGKTETGLQPKERIGIPWMLAFEMRRRGWMIRDEVIWAKRNPLPEPVTDRTVNSHEQIFLFVKKPHYHYDHRAIQEPAVDVNRNANRLTGAPKYADQKQAVAPGQVLNTLHTKGGIRYQINAKGQKVRNRRSVWLFSTKPNREEHFAIMPPEIAELCLLAGCPRRGLVLDPFCGSGTTGVVAAELDLDFIGIELNPEYVKIADRRINRAIRKAAENPRLFDARDAGAAELEQNPGPAMENERPKSNGRLFEI